MGSTDTVPAVVEVGPVVFLTTPVMVGEQSMLPSASVYEDGLRAQHWHDGAVSPESPRSGLCVTVPGCASLPHAPVLIPQLSVFGVWNPAPWLPQLSHALDTPCPCTVVPGHLPECPVCGAASPAVGGGSQGSEIRSCHIPAHRTCEWWCLARSGLVTA